MGSPESAEDVLRCALCRVGTGVEAPDCGKEDKGIPRISAMAAGDWDASLLDLMYLFRALMPYKVSVQT